MKKLLIIGLVFFAFACVGNNNTEADTEATGTEESVDIGAGDDISPQLEMDDDSARLEVDTVSSATEIEQEQQP